MTRRFYAWGILVLLALASCTYQHSEAENAPDETVSITKWTDKTELFVEFSPLLVGKETPFAAHLTDLKTFKPVADGTLRVVLTREKGREAAAVAKAPTVAGIYRPVIKVDEPGSYRLVFHRYRSGTEEIYDSIDAGEIEVLEKQQAARQQAERPQAKGITFLKEQQWRMDFATDAVGEKDLSVLLKMTAEVKPAAAGQVQIVAPVAGRVMIAARGVPVPGQKVKQGEDLAVILPLPGKNRVELDADTRAVNSELEAAEKELQRVEELYKDKIVARKRLEQSQTEVAVRKARLDAARSQLSLLDGSEKFASGSRGQFSLRSPISGTIVAASMTPGAQVEAGQNLLSVIDLDRLWIEGRLFEDDIPKVWKFERGSFSTAALSEPFILIQPKTRLVSIGSVIDPATRSIPFILEARNDEGRLKIGLQGDLAVQTGEKIRGIAIPINAVVDDKGVAVAFVQAEGETFERRELELGIRSEGYAEVKSGLKVDERVVTNGAYRVHLASLSSAIPAHGHGH
ncbi:MAG: efflux RND transporter periplasmic adaptor subunit [Deltaproteobacteria bacterium]|nr:efflux RND transporter periplasmic adaptor subunit [Deltaproteobacteria bacterium]